MAGADYRSCDVCGGKAFYDANLNYEYDAHESRRPFREVGEAQYPDPDMNERYGYCLDYLGDWAVICEDCAKTHRTQVVPIETEKAK